MAKKKEVKKKGYPSPAAVQLISHLSEGAYTTFGKAVKELVNNAFDADATTVHLNFSDDFSKLTIEDDGDGISSKKFKSEFLRIAGSKRRTEQRQRQFKRPLIGKFGIGFLSVARLCEKATLYSKRKGMKTVLVREIPLKHFFDADKQLADLVKQHYYYVLPNRLDTTKDKNYTKIELEGLREDIRKDLSLGQKKNIWNTIDDLPGLDRFKWELGILLPVKYMREFPVKNKSNAVITQAKKELRNFNFKVFVNGDEILKPICLGSRHFKNVKWEYGTKKTIPSNEYDIFDIESPPSANVKFHGYLYNQSKQIQPVSLRGILLRVNHVGIKGFSKSLYEYTKNIGPILWAVSGEIFLDSDFEEVLTLDKDDFKEDHPLFKELVGYIHNRIDDIAAFSRSRSARTRKKRKPAPKVKDLNLTSAGIRGAEKIIGKKNFKKEYFPNLNLSIKTNIKNLRTNVQSLIGTSLDADEGDYLLESLDCFEGNCFRGSVLMAWNTGMFRIHRKIDNDIGYSKLEKAIKARKQIVPSQIKRFFEHSPKSLEELKYFNERALCLVLPKLGLMNRKIADLFYDILGDLRNRSAHPTGHKPEDGEAIFVIQAILRQILNNSQFKIT